MIWLNVEQMALLFGRDYKTIRKHIANALREELAGLQGVAKFATTTPHSAMKGNTQIFYTIFIQLFANIIFFL